MRSKTRSVTITYADNISRYLECKDKPVGYGYLYYMEKIRKIQLAELKKREKGKTTKFVKIKIKDRIRWFDWKKDSDEPILI